MIGLSRSSEKRSAPAFRKLCDPPKPPAALRRTVHQAASLPSDLTWLEAS